jgi:hypothetical protein
MRSYANDEMVEASKSPKKTPLGYLTGWFGMVFLSLPGLAGVGAVLVIGLMVWELILHLHALPRLHR